MTHVFAGVIDGGKHAGTQGHHTAEQQTGKFGEYDKLSVRVDRVFPQPCTQLLTDDDADGRSHGKEGNIEYVAQRKGDVCGCNDVIAANGIALLKQRLTQRPERLVQDQGHPLSCNLPGKLRGNTEAAINTFDKRILLSIAMRPKNDDECLDVTGDHRGDGSPVRAQAGKPQLTEDQQPVADKIDGNGDDSRSHGYNCLPGFPQRTRIALRNGKGRKAQQHQLQITSSVAQAVVDICRLSFSAKIKTEKRCAEAKEHKRADTQKNCTFYQLKAEGIADTVHVSFTEKLRTEDASSGNRPKDRKIEYEQQRVCNGDACHLYCPHPAHHDVIQHTDKVCDAVLDHDGQRDGQRHFIKLFVSDISTHGYLNSEITEAWDLIQP